MKTAAILIPLAALALSGCYEKGSKPMAFDPDFQQRVQDTVAGHLRRTLAGLPPGTMIDSRRFAGSGHNSPCDDTSSDSTAPIRFHTVGELKIPHEAESTDAIRTAGQIWQDWGWQVVERDGFRTPNRFGNSPDGYRLQIVATVPGHPPTVQASSPCFARPMAREGLPFPEIITAG